MVCSCLFLPLLADPMKGVLGNLQTSLQRFYQKRNKERGYLNGRWITSPSRQQGILFVAESSNVTQKPTSSQRDCWSRPLPEGHSLNDWMLEQRHRWSSVVRATLPPSTLFADRALLHRGYSISESNALVETVSKYKGLH